MNKISFLTGLLLLVLIGMVNTDASAQSSIALNEEFNFKVFPNPNQTDAETFISLNGFKATDLLVVVYDMLGREIYSKVEMVESDGYLFTLTSDGKKLPAGMYLIIASADDKVFKQKLVVK